MKLAIIGSGISGMATAYLLNERFDITVYEAENYLGGHSRTLNIDSTDIDTGFIVFNHKNYPNLSKLFKHLEVETVPSNMSFGVSINDGWLEYGTQRLTDIFAQTKNLAKPSFYKMLYDIKTFNSQAVNHVKLNPELSVACLLEKMGLGAWFKQYYLLAMAGAIWSSPANQILDFPASTLINFFNNHGLLTVADQPQWYTVKGGSKNYVNKISEKLSEKIMLNNRITSVVRQEDGILVINSKGQKQKYDQVILACHSDQALHLIEKPTANEHEILSSIKYQPNQVILHSDPSFMPKNKQAWASWVYLNSHNKKISLSYWMNNLQPLNSQQNYFVTLNPNHTPKSIHNSHCFSHPLFDQAAIAAQTRLHEIQGKDRIWFCGAWQKYGFHEDGLNSALAVAKSFGEVPKWT